MTAPPGAFACPRCRKAGQIQHGNDPWCEACQAANAPPRTYNRRKLRRKLRLREERAAGQRKEHDGRPPAPQQQ